ncbi:MAG: thiamine pyrophosphate-dependent enzyme [Geobacteraceae bacterium]
MSDTKPGKAQQGGSDNRLGTGTPMCAGCGGLAAIKEIYDVVGEKSVFINAAGCMTLLANYPFTPFRGSWLYTAMASAPAGAQGVRDALDILIAKGRLPQEEDLETVVLTGDGSAYGMGLSATSGALDRSLSFLYICYDNEGYGNTGQQASAATPLGAKTATSRGPLGNPVRKKDLFSIWAAHRPTYVATVSPAHPTDLVRKLNIAKSLNGPRLILAFAPCPTGWGFDPRETIEMGKLAVQSGVWPLKEYREGVVSHTIVPRKLLPVADYLQRQGRFSHLFLPQRNEELLQEIQSTVDAYWEEVTH